MATTLLDAKRRKESALASMRELQLEEKKGSLVSRAAVEKEWFRLARTLRDNFVNLPARCAGLVAAERDQQKCYDILDREVRQMLEGLTNGTPERDTASRSANPGSFR